MAEELQQNSQPAQPDFQMQAPNKKEITETENPAQRFENILIGINEAKEKENSAMEKSLYEQAADLFREYTNQNLIEKAENAAREEIEAEGGKIISKETLLSEENFRKEVEAFKFKQQNFSVQKSWEKLSKEEKNIYSNDVNLFIAAIEKKIEELKKSGFGISKEVFYNISANGYMLLNIKKSFFGNKIILPILIGDGAYKFESMSIREFENLLGMLQGLFDLIATQAVTDRLGRDSLRAKRRWHRRKMRKVKEIIKAVAKTIKEEEIQESERAEIKKKMEEKIKEKIKKEVEAEERATLEKLANIGEVGALEKLRDFEKLEKKTDKNIKKEIEKLEKGLTKDIQERTREEEKITSLLKKQMEKGKLSKKRKAYINKVTNTVQEPPEETSPPAAEEKIEKPEEEKPVE